MGKTEPSPRTHAFAMAIKSGESFSGLRRVEGDTLENVVNAKKPRQRSWRVGFVHALLRSARIKQRQGRDLRAERQHFLNAHATTRMRLPRAHSAFFEGLTNGFLNREPLQRCEAKQGSSGHRPQNFGARFSRKAARPSAKSSLSKQAAASASH